MKARGAVRKENIPRRAVRYRELGEPEFDYAFDLLAEKDRLDEEYKKVNDLTTVNYQEYKDQQTELAAINKNKKLIDDFMQNLSNDGYHSATKIKPTKKRQLWHDSLLEDVIIPFHQTHKERPSIREAITIIRKLIAENHSVFEEIKEDEVRDSILFVFADTTNEITRSTVEKTLSRLSTTYIDSLKL
jgi:hypothetical protein